MSKRKQNSLLEYFKSSCESTATVSQNVSVQESSVINTIQDQESNSVTKGPVPAISMVRVNLENGEEYKAVSKCSSKWDGPINSCTKGNERQPPVTSKNTGITYVNGFCAICNQDGEQLVVWPVEIRCCEEHDRLENPANRRFTYMRNVLYSMASRGLRGVPRRCKCQFVNQNGDYGFADSLELRKWQPELIQSQCSNTWTDEAMKSLCDSFLDPVYSRKKVYRNLFCAQCNYQNMDMVSCKPAIIEKMISEGVDDKKIYDTCKQNKYSDCIYYFSNVMRGFTYGFSDVFNIDKEVCIPPKGKKCCKGEKYDYRSQSCRKLNKPVLRIAQALG